MAVLRKRTPDYIRRAVAEEAFALWLSMFCGLLAIAFAMLFLLYGSEPPGAAYLPFF